LYRGINDFKKGYRHRCNIVKDEKGDLVADSHSIVARRRKYFSQLFNVHGVKDVGQAETHTEEPLVLEPSAAEVELAIDKLKSHKPPGIDQIPAELIKAGSRTICLEIHKLITSIWKKEKLSEEWKESIIVPVHRKGDKTDCNNYRGILLLPRIDNSTFERMEEFKYLGTTLTNQNSIAEEIKSRLRSGSACYNSVENLLSSRLLSKNLKIKIYRTIILPAVLYGCETWSLKLREKGSWDV